MCSRPTARSPVIQVRAGAIKHPPRNALSTQHAAAAPERAAHKPAHPSRARTLSPIALKMLGHPGGELGHELSRELFLGDILAKFHCRFKGGRERGVEH